MAYAERELNPKAWAAALFQDRPPQQHEIASALDGAIERGRQQERDRAARIAEASGFGEHEDGGNPDITWVDAQQRSRRLCHLVAEAIRTSPEDVQRSRMDS